MDKEKLREHWEDFIGVFKRTINRLRRRVPQILNDEPEEPKTIIVVDLDGGDNAPDAVKRGIKKAIIEDFVEPEEIIAIGTSAAIKKFYELSWIDRCWQFLRIFKNPLEGVLALECTDKIEMDDDYNTIGKKRRTSAMGIGINMVKTAKARALVSAGNTAGMVGLGSFILGKPGKNVKPAIAVPLPNNNSNGCLILDAGAIHRASAEDLYNCALMGSIYAQAMWQIEEPIVKLLNIGGEAGKGNPDIKGADSLLHSNSYWDLGNKKHKRLPDGSLDGKINYQGNIEGDKVFTDDVNVIVCSGEMGNNTIKVGEGVLNLVKDKMGILWKFVSFFWNHHKRSDYKEVGGAILLGVNGILIISHGKSDSMAIANAIRRAKQEAKMQVVETIKQKF